MATQPVTPDGLRHIAKERLMSSQHYRFEEVCAMADQWEQDKADLAEAQYRVERMQNEFGLEADAVYWEQRATTAEMKYQEIQAQVEALREFISRLKGRGHALDKEIDALLQRR